MKVERVSYEESKVFVSLIKAEIERTAKNEGGEGESLKSVDEAFPSITML